MTLSPDATLSSAAAPGPGTVPGAVTVPHGFDAPTDAAPGPLLPDVAPGTAQTPSDHAPSDHAPGRKTGQLAPNQANGGKTGPLSPGPLPASGAAPTGSGAPPGRAPSPGSARGTVVGSCGGSCPRTTPPRTAPIRSRLIRELPPEERPRERLVARGVAALSNPELLALVWGSGGVGRSAVEIASDAVALHGGLAGLATASVVELEHIPGVGAARACQLVAAFELGRRLLADWPSGRITVRTPRDVADRLVLQMGRLDREELRVVLLNTKNQVLGIQTVYQGNVSTALVRVGELFRDAVRQSASGMILVHNHPSGDPTPSPDDLHLTAEAIAAGRILDVPVLDHLVIGHDAFVSLRDRGVVFERPGGGG